jgi:hypothetical protein
MHVQTDHQIISFPPDSMVLFDNHLDDPDATGTTLVSAQRVDNVWIVKADGHDDVKVPAATANQPPRENVIKAMVDLALEVSPGDGYSTLIPRELKWLP